MSYEKFKNLIIEGSLFGIAVALSTFAKFGNSKINLIQDPNLKKQAFEYDLIEDLIDRTVEELKKIRSEVPIDRKLESLTQTILGVEKNSSELAFRQLPKTLKDLLDQ